MKGLDGVSAQALSDTIGAIYDCALDPSRWKDAFRRIVQLCDSTAGGMCIHDFTNLQNDTLFEYGYPAEWSPQYQKLHLQSQFSAIPSVCDVGEVTTLLTHVSESELVESRFYRDVLKPYGYFDFIALMALRSGNRLASVHACRMEDAPRYGDRDKDFSSCYRRTSAARSPSPMRLTSGRFAPKCWRLRSTGLSPVSS